MVDVDAPATGVWTIQRDVAPEDREVGWYRDPDHPGEHRYWDGSTWSTLDAAFPRPRAATGTTRCDGDDASD